MTLLPYSCTLVLPILISLLNRIKSSCAVALIHPVLRVAAAVKLESKTAQPGKLKCSASSNVSCNLPTNVWVSDVGCNGSKRKEILMHMHNTLPPLCVLARPDEKEGKW